VLARGDVIEAEDLSDRLVIPAAQDTAPGEPPETLEEVERRHIEQVLGESATLEEAAARLGVNVTTLWRKRKRYGLG
jgi:NtrC-family two-component system response regulator AlgB